MTNCHGPGLAQAVLARMSGTPARPVTSFENHLAARLATLARPLLETRELMRIPRALALFMLAFLALPSAASAQTPPTQGSITANLISATRGGMAIPNLMNDTLDERGFNAVECAASETVSLEIGLGNLPAGRTFVDAWLGEQGQDCATEASRVNGTERVCVHLGDDLEIVANQVTINLDAMMDPDDPACDGTAAQGETFRLYLFATGATETTGPVTLADYVYVTFKVDANAPAAPTPASGTRTGDETIPVSWSSPTDQGTLSFNVYVDTSVATCTGVGQWEAGDPAPTDVEPDGESSGSSAGVDTDGVGLAVGQSALVYVTSVDLAENESVLSSAVCITRMETGGFCDALEAGGEECTNTCAATLPRTRTAAGALWLGLALLALVVRRRTR